MKWKIQYRKKGCNKIVSIVKDLHFEYRNDVCRWFLSVFSTKIMVHLDNDWTNRHIECYRQDYEFINAKKLKPAVATAK